MKVTVNPPPRPQGTVTIEDIPMEVAEVIKYRLGSSIYSGRSNGIRLQLEEIYYALKKAGVTSASHRVQWQQTID